MLAPTLLVQDDPETPGPSTLGGPVQAEYPIRGRPGLARNAWQFGYLLRAETRLALRAAPRIRTGMTILYITQLLAAIYDALKPHAL